MKLLFIILLFPVIGFSQVNPLYMDQFLRVDSTALAQFNAAFRTIIIQLNTAQANEAALRKTNDSLQTAINKKQDSLKLAADKANTAKDKSQDSIGTLYGKQIAALQKLVTKVDTITSKNLPSPIRLTRIGTTSQVAIDIDSATKLKHGSLTPYSFNLIRSLQSQITALQKQVNVTKPPIGNPAKVLSYDEYGLSDDGDSDIPLGFGTNTIQNVPYDFRFTTGTNVDPLSVTTSKGEITSAVAYQYQKYSDVRYTKQKKRCFFKRLLNWLF